MTATSAAGVPVREDGHPALRRLIRSDVDAFAERHWGRAPLLSRAAELPGGFNDLFSASAVDELVSTRGLRTPFLRMAKDGTTILEGLFTRGGGVGAAIADQVSDDALLTQFSRGATMVLQGLHRLWPPLIDFAQQLAADLGHPTQVNAYVTPPQSTGFSDHYDVHDVFVVQVAGEKRWRIREPVRALPLRDEPWTEHRAVIEESAAHGQPMIEATLEPGDCLYLPRGFLHAATALGRTSIHLTIGVHPWTRRHLADQLARVALDRASEDPSVRASLPLEADLCDPGARAGDLELVRAALLRAIREVEPEDLAPALAAAVRKSQRAAPLGPLAQVDAAAALTPNDTVRMRPHVAASLLSSDGPPVLQSRAGVLELDAGDLHPVATLLAHGEAPVADLGLDLARQLMLAGIVVLG